MDILMLLYSKFEIWNPDSSEIRAIQMKLVFGAIIILAVLFVFMVVLPNYKKIKEYFWKKLDE
ncbi:hypothetical protein [Macrococcus armenti]|uniref:hypothetical protein n=1 Tax=Macrococcus armenti TaxID=2875764 RepID=UPI001CCCD434|nr:hypothetical protein [Macrococcus armenti]UBH16610.1 hypothetical protein LAU44_11910 [Macrococcus armenti]UBH21244.1 hypothetical protein LAU40_11945 [Macrococcus armenti]